ncbi:trypsin-like serine protease [Futiania mangrovi]|uniref:Trypsin-like serine protease n=1 Tax=Futiania mangrovi TaxID=2959716 RepID=A0A9J6PNW3_9PROT|nr:trypsin-like serine protease [Futiania mangrovii]MCP1337778.1 trypsin-like serine protease [Futiania mangrovii]
MFGKDLIRSVLTALGLVFLCAGSAHAVPLGASTQDSSSVYPYVGSVYYGSWGSGILIAPDVVLTAGHVVEEALSYAGTSVFLTGVGPFTTTPPETATSIIGGILHPSYDPSVFGENDIGILFLSANVNLAQYSVLFAEPASGLGGEAASVVGYGLNLTRRIGSLAIDSAYTTDNAIWAFDSSIPMVEGGDSGGGLFVERGGQQLLAGITSFTSISAPYYSYFVSVSGFREFIDGNAPQAQWYGGARPVSEPSAVVVFGLAIIGLLSAAGRPRSQ